MKAFQLAIIAAVFAGGYCCSYGFEDINGECFAFHNEVILPWENAKEFCANASFADASLAKITSAETLRAVYDFILDFELTGSYWLGGSDLALEDDFVWLDGSAVPRETPYWAIHNNLIGSWTHEPNGGLEENCLLLDEHRLYYFNDANCNLLNFPICEEI